MPISDLLADLGLLPLRAIAFQCVLLLVAIALEGALLRQRLRVGFQTSMQYATTLNLMATSLGWLGFLALESVLPEALRTQVMSYVLFNRFYANGVNRTLPLLILVAGFGAFFATFWIKYQGLEWLLRLLGRRPVEGNTDLRKTNRQERYDRARQGRGLRSATSNHLVAVLEANALSFSAVLLLLLLRNALLA